MLIDAIENFIGIPPAGYEIIEYLIAGILLIFLLKSAFMFLGSIFNKVSEC